MSNALRKYRRRKRTVKIVELDRVLNDLNDKPFSDAEGGFTLRRAMKAALGNSVPSDQTADAKAKEHCYDLMVQVKNANGELEISSEDVAIIKKRVGEMYPPWIVGQAAKMIEGN